VKNLAVNKLNGFWINTPLISLEVVLAQLDTLRIHEEIIPEKMRELVDKIPGDGVFIHPIIVDVNSFIVLDGMHRVAAAREIGLKFIPVCLVDYANPNISIGCWYRMFKALNNAEKVKNIVQNIGLTSSEETYERSKELVESRKAITAFFSESSSFVVKGYALDAKKSYDVIRGLEVTIQSLGYKMGYSTEKDAPSRITSGEYLAGLMTPTLKKNEVIETVLSGRLFSQKTTRHIIPARPMNVNVPIDWLWGRQNLDDMNNRLRDYLSSRQIDKLPPGQLLDRRYDEELYVFR
jgi:hypothetical protein